MGSKPPMSAPVTLAVIGCGQRGSAYADYALKYPLECKVVAIAEPRKKTRENFAKRHEQTIENDLVFDTWEAMVGASKAKGSKLCDAVVIAVQDQLHKAVVLAFAELRYDILCEKPMATTIQDCLDIHDAIVKANVIFGMGHVMRYSPYSKAITAIIDSGELGKLVNATQVEPVGYFHFAHSYVRGNWHSEEKSSFVLMTKSCHDIDILCRWMLPATPVHISSFGSRMHFRKSEKPPEAGDATRCMVCPINSTCPYSAKRIYWDAIHAGRRNWPVSPLVDGIPDIENVTVALQEGPYGQCVYEASNDVNDNQVVNIQFSNGATVSFTLVAFTEAICDRQVRLHFTHGEIIGDMSTFTVSDFRARSRITKNPPLEGGGHGGGDLGLAKTFVEAVRNQDQTILGTNIAEVLQSHLTVFAAEQARRENKVIDYVAFEREVRAKYQPQEAH